MSSLFMVLSIVSAPFAVWVANDIAYPFLNKKDLSSFIVSSLIFLLVGCGIPLFFLTISFLALQ